LFANSTITVAGYGALYIYGNLNGTARLPFKGMALRFTVNATVAVQQYRANGVWHRWYSANTYSGNFTVNDAVLYLTVRLRLEHQHAMTLNGQASVQITANINITNQS